jgi:prepilin-type N-terminal cleavage/methylation domain-containing protein
MPTSSEGGMTIIETMIAMVVLSVGALSAISTLTKSTALDDDLKERSIALRAAMSKMESIVAYDYNDQIANLVAYWQLNANKDFTVDGLKPQTAPNGAVQPVGSIAFDNTDPQRIVATVTVNWVTRQGLARTLSLPRTVTEVVK